MAKKATNVTIREELLSEAKEIGLNLSQTLEEALEEKLRLSRRDAWVAENRDSIESYRQHVEKHGTLGMQLKHLRRF